MLQSRPLHIQLLKIPQKFYHVGTFDQLHVQSEVVLSQKFWSGEKSGSGDQNPKFQEK